MVKTRSKSKVLDDKEIIECVAVSTVVSTLPLFIPVVDSVQLVIAIPVLLSKSSVEERVLIDVAIAAEIKHAFEVLLKESKKA